jgi:hypothetical protein
VSKGSSKKSSGRWEWQRVLGVQISPSKADKTGKFDRSPLLKVSVSVVERDAMVTPME